MKVFDLHCSHGHAFEGWFASEADYQGQLERRLVACPVCEDTAITRRPSAPRLNLSGTQGPAEGRAEPAPPAAATQTVTRPADLQASWLQAVRELVERTEDVGERFAEEARRIHYGESPQRGIRGQASPEERQALQEEGIETVAIPVPAALKRPLQ